MTTAATITRTVTGHQRDIASRLTKARGQLRGVHAMYDNGRSCIDVLDQLSAVAAATDAIALLILEDHIRACVRDAIDGGDTDEKVDELVTAVRRCVRGHRSRR